MEILKNIQLIQKEGRRNREKKRGGGGETKKKIIK